MLIKLFSFLKSKNMLKSHFLLLNYVKKSFFIIKLYKKVIFYY